MLKSAFLAVLLTSSMHAQTTPALPQADVAKTGANDRNQDTAARKNANGLHSIYRAESEKLNALYEDYEASRRDAVVAARTKFLGDGWVAPAVLDAEDIPADTVPPPAAPE